MRRPRHISSAALLALARRRGGRLPAGQASHLADCLRCQGDVRRLRVLADHLREPPTEPPAGVVARAWALMEPRPPTRADRSRFKIARLVFDSHHAGAVAGVRAATATRHQLWRGTSADVEVRLEGAGLGTEAALMGQVLPRRRWPFRLSHGTVWLLEPGRPPRWTWLGPSGEFTLPAPRGERWVLCLEWDSLRLRLGSR